MTIGMSKDYRKYRVSSARAKPLKN